MNFVDALFLFTLTAVLPVTGAVSYRRYARRVAAGEAPNTVEILQHTMYLQWALLATLTALWVFDGRAAAVLGVTASSPSANLWGLSLVAAMCLLLGYSLYSARAAGHDERQTFREGLGVLRHFLPSQPRQLRWFYGLSVTAGIVEELLYRGYLFWLFAPFMSESLVVLASAFIFSLGHAYQGIGGMARVFLVGLAFGGLYLLTGSIWVPMLAHALLDIFQGAIIYEYLRRRGDPPTADPEPFPTD